ncbi:MAG: SAF domain-containing protein [Microthrixaceae bacterium]
MSWTRYLPTSFPDHPLADAAHLLRRQRAPQMLAAAALALVSAGLVLRAETRVQAAERTWGDTASVAVATDDLSAGTPLNSSRVRLQRLPAMALAADVIDEPAWAELSASDAIPVAARTLAKGEPLRRGALVGGGAPGVGADSVVAFPEGTLAPRLEAGDRVLVVAGAALGGDAVPSRTVADGVVVGPPPDDEAARNPTDGETGWVAWVAVRPHEAADVARVALSGSAALVLDSHEGT